MRGDAKQTPEARVERMEALAWLLELLAVVFAYPSRHQVALMQTAELAELFEGLVRAANIDAPLFESTCVVFRQALDDGSLGDFRVEFSRLFCVPHAPIIPRGGVWVRSRTPDSLACGERACVAREYRTVGLRKNAQVNEPEDALVSELEFAAFLTRKELEALDGDDAQAADRWRLQRIRFFREHLGEFAVAVCDQIDRRSNNALMLLCSALLRAVVDSQPWRPPRAFL